MPVVSPIKKAKISLKEFSGIILDVNIKLWPRELKTDEIKPTKTISFQASLLILPMVVFVSTPLTLNKSNVKIHITLTNTQAIID